MNNGLQKFTATFKKIVSTYPDYSLKNEKLLKYITFMEVDGIILGQIRDRDAYEGVFYIFLAPKAFSSHRKLKYCYSRFMFTGPALYIYSYRRFYKIIRNEIYKALEDLINFIKEDDYLKELVPWEGGSDEK